MQAAGQQNVPITVARASEILAPQQSVLIRRSRAEGARTCVLTNLHEQLHPDAAEVIAAMRPPKSAKQSVAAHAYGVMQESF